MRIKKRMTAAEFDTVKPFLGISQERISAAQRALVLGHKYIDIANDNNWSKQAVGSAVNAVWTAFDKYKESQRAANSAGMILPAGWEQVTVVAPSHLIKEFQERIARELEKDK